MSYKKSVVKKKQIRRATKNCSTWELLDAELRKIKQIFVNNDYPVRVIDDIYIASRIINSFVKSNGFEKENEISFYVQRLMHEQGVWYPRKDHQRACHWFERAHQGQSENILSTKEVVHYSRVLVGVEQVD